MHKSTELKRQNVEKHFVKGMTLDKYMENYIKSCPTDPPDQTDTIEQNLYQSTQEGMRKDILSKNIHMRIDQIDQQSLEESIDYHKAQHTQATPFFQSKQRHTLSRKKKKAQGERSKGSKIANIQISSPNYSKNVSIQNTKFRIKRMSVSPLKHKSKQLSPTTSITLYGTKFGHIIKKPEVKIPQLLTFYGKLCLQVDQSKQDKKILPKTLQSERKIKKKNQLELNQILMIDNRHKYNHSHNTHYPEMQVWGVKDKLTDRKSKF